MKITSLFFLLAFAFSCNPNRNQKSEKLPQNDSTSTDSNLVEPPAQDIVDEEMQTAFMVILDSSTDYHALRSMAEKTATDYQLEFDTLEKQYYPDKNLWGVAIWSEDEI